MKTNLSRYIFISLFIFLCLFSSCEDSLLGPDAENTPINNFNILWHQYDMYYPTFVYKNLNWDSLHDAYGKIINDQTSESELWDIITGMLMNFNDIHVSIYNRDRRKYFSSSDVYYRHNHEFSLYVIESAYLAGNYKQIGENNFVYGRMPGDTLVGYLHIASFKGDYIWPNDVDLILTELSTIKTLIIDLRDNSGGYYVNYRRIAENFLNKPVTYCKEIARNGIKHADLTLPVNQTLLPGFFGPKFSGKIIIITNRTTESSGEDFAQVFKCLPNSIQIGDTTAGGMGGTDRKFQLPNGWYYNMPTTVNITLEGNCLEGIGIAPDICVKNTPQQINNGFDNQLEYVLKYIKKHE